MWRKQEVHRDFFWIGVVAGFAIVGLVVVGFLLGTEMGAQYAHAPGKDRSTRA